MKLFKALLTAVGLAICLPLATTSVAAGTTDDTIEQLAEEAYLYGLQQVIFYGQRWIYTQNNNKDNMSYSGVNRLL